MGVERDEGLPTQALPEPANAEAASAKPTSTYMVQRYDALRSTDAVGDVWEDVGTVELPLRSHRKGAVALAVQGMTPKPPANSRFRILDAEAMQLFALRQKPKPPVSDEYEVVAL